MLDHAACAKPEALVHTNTQAAMIKMSVVSIILNSLIRKIHVKYFGALLQFRYAFNSSTSLFQRQMFVRPEDAYG